MPLRFHPPPSLPRPASLPAVLALALGLLMASGCTTQAVRVAIVEPAAVDVSRYRNLGVESFKGPDGPAYARDISIGLSAARNPSTGEKLFQVVDRQNLQSILEELERQRGDLWDPDTARGLGKLVGAALIIHGEVQILAPEEQLSELPISKDGKQTIYRTRTLNQQVTVYFRASDTETGAIVDEVKIDEIESLNTYATNAMPARIDPLPLIDQARRDIVKRYVARLVPQKKFRRVNLYTTKEFPELGLGNNYAQTGNWERALDSYQRALDRMTGEYREFRYMGLFNCGVALEGLHRFEEARQHFEEAYALKPEGNILSELGQMGERESDVRTLIQQGQLVPQN